jgi:protein-disulfide isomerase
MRALLASLAGIAAAFGCHGAQERQAPPDAMATQIPAPESGPRSADDEYWAHTKQVFGVPVGRSPALGRAGALVTIVEFSEFQCRSCSNMDLVLRAIREKYGDEVRVVWKNRPLSLQPAAEPAAEAALEVRSQKGDAAFWEVHDRFVDRPDDLMNGKSPDIDAIVAIASSAGTGTGASADEVRKAVARHTHREEIDADLDLAEDFEVEGTPHFFVNGRRLEGVQPRDKLERMIDEEMQRARALLATGTPPEALYETIVARGTGPWRPTSRPLRPLPAKDPALGDPSAKVTVHVWSDYQCALCVAVERMMSDLRKEHGARIRFVWHDLPLPRHREASLFARAAREAYEQKGTVAFWAMHDEIVYDPRVPGRSDLDGFARHLNLDMSRWKAALDGEAHASEIEADESAARDEGITETPAFLVVAGNAPQGAFVGNIEYASKLHRVVEMALDGEAHDGE